MNLDMYKEYRFAQANLISTQSGKIYKCRFDRNDRFYLYLKPYIKAGGVSELTNLMIDMLVIENFDETFFEEKSFTFNAIILAKDKQDCVWSYNININNIKINRVNVTKLSYENENLVFTLCQMEIPYRTKIDIVERV